MIGTKKPNTQFNREIFATYFSAPQSPPHRRRKKLNMRMKSFSLDTPEPPKQHAIDESSKKKSSSLTTSTCFGGRISFSFPLFYFQICTGIFFVLNFG